MISKPELVNALEANDLVSVAALARDDRKILSRLVRLAYDKDTLVGWRAIKAVGHAARAMLPADYPFLRETVRKLLWSLSDESGGIGWSSPEMLGEIVSADPRRFSDIIPPIVEVYGIEEEHFRPGVLYALTRIAETEAEFVLGYRVLAIQGMADDNTLVRVYGLKLAKALFRHLPDDDRESFLSAFRTLEADTHEVWIYKDGGFVNVQVREAARAVLDVFSGEVGESLK